MTHHVPEAATSEEAIKLKDHLAALHDPHVFQVHGPVITLADDVESLTFTSKASEGAKVQKTMALWSGHWSPRRFKVTAEMIVADPPLAERRLENARAVRGRVVLVERYSLPIMLSSLLCQ